MDTVKKLADEVLDLALNVRSKIRDLDDDKNCETFRVCLWEASIELKFVLSLLNAQIISR